MNVIYLGVFAVALPAAVWQLLALAVLAAGLAVAFHGAVKVLKHLTAPQSAPLLVPAALPMATEGVSVCPSLPILDRLAARAPPRIAVAVRTSSPQVQFPVSPRSQCLSSSWPMEFLR